MRSYPPIGMTDLILAFCGRVRREGDFAVAFYRLIFMEHRMGFEPMNTGFADQRVSHFATGAHGSAAR